MYTLFDGVRFTDIRQYSTLDKEQVWFFYLIVLFSVSYTSLKDTCPESGYCKMDGTETIIFKLFYGGIIF